MRHILTSILPTIFVFHAFGQVMSKENDEALLKKLKVKSVVTRYYDHEDTTKAKGKLLFKKTYNSAGNITSKYLLSLWDVVSYDHTTTYQYDKNNRLIDETVIQKILNLGKRDEEYIQALGVPFINMRCERQTLKIFP